MQIRQLEYFMLVANTLNITHAAERAHVSQPALSRQIRLLEEELGNKLLDRKARGVSLTPIGQKLSEHIAELMQSMDYIKHDIMSSADIPVGSIRFAVSNSVSSLLTKQVVSEFRRLYPSVQIQVIEGTSMNMREALLTNKADVALFSDHGAFTGLNRIPLCTEALVLIAPASSGLEMDTPVETSSLANLDLILTPFPNGLRRVIDEATLRHGQLTEPALTVDTNSLIMNLVCMGCGYSVLPYSGTHDAYELGQVSIAPIADVSWSWVLATSRDRPVTAAGKAIIDLTVKHVDKLVDVGTWRTARVLA